MQLWHYSQEQKDHWKHIKYVSFREWLHKLGYFCPKPGSPELAGGFFTTAPPGKPHNRLHAMLKFNESISVYRLGMIFCIFYQVKKQAIENHLEFATFCIKPRRIINIYYLYKKHHQMNSLKADKSDV